MLAHLEESDPDFATYLWLAASTGAGRSLEGLTSVGLLTVRASAGRTVEALDGYRSLREYRTRTRASIQQWTTLRNLARLLRSLGDGETAGFSKLPLTTHPMHRQFLTKTAPRT